MGPQGAQSAEGILTSDIADQILSGTYIPENQRTRDTTLVSYARMVNRLLYKNGHFGHDTMVNKECCIRAFEKYESEVLCSAPVTLGSLTQDYLQKYCSYRFSGRGNKSIETAGKAMIPLFAAIRARGILSKSSFSVSTAAGCGFQMPSPWNGSMWTKRISGSSSGRSRPGTRQEFLSICIRRRLRFSTGGGAATGGSPRPR